VVDGGSVQVEREVAAPPEHVWDLVADVTRMGEWSPEAESATWLGGADAPAPGARFRGTNRQGKRHWSTTATVVAAERGRSFAFDIAVGPFKVARWGYELVASDRGCLVTETWTDQRGWTATVLGRAATGVADRSAHNRATMTETLERLAAAAESAGD